MPTTTEIEAIVERLSYQDKTRILTSVICDAFLTEDDEVDFDHEPTLRQFANLKESLRQEFRGGEAAACCHECGDPMVINEDGTTDHLTEDGEIDYDKNADHVAILDSED